MAKNQSFFLEGKKREGVLLCHTLAGSPSEMMPLAKKLHKEGYFVSCPLYPGHDQSFNDVVATQVPSWYQVCLDAYDALKEKVDKVFVVGMSIGGTFTVKLAQDRSPSGIATVNAPIIGFDIENDMFKMSRQNNDSTFLELYRKHRTNYFDFVVKIGQIEELKKISCPLFVLQGSLDDGRYKTSTQMLMSYTNSKTKQRKDYPRSAHLLLLDQDRKEAMKDIINFFNNM